METTGHELQKEVSPMKTALRYGLFTGLGGIIFFLIFYVMNVMPTGGIQYLSYLILAAGVYLGMAYHRDHENGGFMSYGRAFGTGALISVVTGVVSAVFNYIFFAFIDPSYMNRMMDIAEENMIKQGMSEEQIAQGMEMSKNFATPAMTGVFAFVGYLFMGVVLSLILAAVAKKNKPMFE